MIVEPIVHLRTKIIEGINVTLSLLLGDTILETLGQEELRVRDAWGKYCFFCSFLVSSLLPKLSCVMTYL